MWFPDKSSKVNRIFCYRYLAPFIRRITFVTFACLNTCIKIARIILAKKGFHIDFNTHPFRWFLRSTRDPRWPNKKDQTHYWIENPPKRWGFDFISTFNLNFYWISFTQERIIFTINSTIINIIHIPTSVSFEFSFL